MLPRGPVHLALPALLLSVTLAACMQAQESTPAPGPEAQPETPTYYYEPAWSPDGTRIAFYSNRDGNYEIYTVRPDGTDLQRLTQNEHADGVMDWSPDGTRLAFSSNRDGVGTIYIMQADGTNPVRAADIERAGAPVWSPDGTRIAFEGRVDGNRDIFVMQADGTGVTRLTKHEANDFRPGWSPDGKQLAFKSNRGGSYDLYLMNPDGSNVVRLMETETHESHPAWAPTGRRILFNRTRVDTTGAEVGLGLHVLNVETGAETQLTSGDELEPCWAPDGQRIVYRTEDAEGVMGLYVMHADGTNRHRIVPGSESNMY